MTTSNSKIVALIQNLPNNITTPEIRAFFSRVHLITDDNIHIISTTNRTKCPKAFVTLPSEIILRKAITELSGKCVIDSDRHPVQITASSRKELNREISLLRQVLIKENLTLTCEWIGCNQIFQDRSLYLSHINRNHVPLFDSINLNTNHCQWQGCFDDCKFVNREHFQLHLSFHAYHNQLMNIGQQIMDVTVPKPTCYNDSSARNMLTDLSQALKCGWKDCGGEFFDVETFFIHVGIHAIEDVVIPMMSKEKLKKVRFAKCQWIKCQATFKKKSHLKVHLNSHTQKKAVACPTCGTTFSTRMGFLNHCYRQETPTNVDNNHRIEPNTFSAAVDDEPEGILTIDEDANPSSIVIHLPSNLQTIINPQKPNSTDQPMSTDTEKALLSDQNVALLVNFDSGQSTLPEGSDGGGGSGQTGGNKVIQLQLAPANSQSTDIVREFPCSQCSKSFNTQDLLWEHQMNHSRKYRCSHCPFRSGYQSRLREHILYRHTDNYAFQCTFCELRFKTRRSLQKHIELHKSEKKKCQVCQQTFTSYYQLKRHVRMQHLKEEIIFACHLCTKHYNRGNNLSRHLIGTHKLKVADGWSRFVYDKRQQDGVFSINPASCCGTNGASSSSPIPPPESMTQ